MELKNGYKIHIILSCVRGVDTDTTFDAIKHMTELGVLFYNDIDTFISINNLINPQIKKV